jgi:hypothetical protein
MLGGERDAQRAALGHSQQVRPLDADRVHHRPDVIDSLGQGGRAFHRIREPGAAFIEQDQPAERCQPVQEAGQIRPVPGRLNMRHEPWHQHQIRRP